jgi:murein DD-endopeptidase MepM/ murein hydrolase activator NlpD
MKYSFKNFNPNSNVKAKILYEEPDNINLSRGILFKDKVEYDFLPKNIQALNKNFINFSADNGIDSLKVGEKVKLNNDEIIITDPYGIRNFKGQEGQHSTGIDSLKVGEKVKLNNDEIIITDPYGIRNFKGQEGQHSTGIDFETKSGKVIALKDGVITDVKLQGDGKIYHPSSGKKEAGYYITVKHDDGSKAQYMHLDPMSKEDMDSLKNKRIKRGEHIWGYTTGSGTMTGPHVKFRLFGEDPRVNIDPSQAIRGQNYNFIPDKNGKNILNK